MVIVFIIFSHRFQNAGLESSSTLNIQISSIIMNCSGRGEQQSYIESPTFPLSTRVYCHTQGTDLRNYMFETTAASLAHSTTTSAAQSIQQPFMLLLFMILPVKRKTSNIFKRLKLNFCCSNSCICTRKLKTSLKVSVVLEF